jgi:hypothetical protein
MEEKECNVSVKQISTENFYHLGYITMLPVESQQTTHHYIMGPRTLYNHHCNLLLFYFYCKDLKFYTFSTNGNAELNRFTSDFKQLNGV